MSRFLVAAVFLGLATFVVAAPVPPDRRPPDTAAIKKRFYGCWRETWFETDAGDGAVRFVSRPAFLSAYQFSEKDGLTWNWSGELDLERWPPMVLDTSHTPMRFDLLHYGPHGKPTSAIPGIFKFEGARLILAVARPTTDWRTYSPTGDYAHRPTDFKPQQNVAITVMERCELREQYRPPAQVPNRP